jgi:hypothetical protein
MVQLVEVEHGFYAVQSAQPGCGFRVLGTTPDAKAVQHVLRLEANISVGIILKS